MGKASALDILGLMSWRCIPHSLRGKTIRGEAFASWRYQLFQPEALTPITAQAKFPLAHLPDPLEHMP